MDPINKKERSARYWQFLGLYIASIIVVVIAVHFNNESNKSTADELKRMREETKLMNENTKIFYDKMNKVEALLKEMEDPSANSDRITDDIKSQISDMKDIVKNSPSVNDSVYVKIYDRYYDVLQDKRKIQGSNASSSAVEALNAKLEKANAELDECNKQLIAAKALSGGQ